MNFELRSMTAADVDAERNWRYPEPYRTYGLGSDPAEADLMLAQLASEERWFTAVSPGSDEMLGFFEFVLLGDEVEIGLGLRPDLTGRGFGVSFVEAGLAFARGRWAPRTFALDVFPWNERAITVYERAGFERGVVYTRHFDGGLERVFLRMSRLASVDVPALGDPPS